MKQMVRNQAGFSLIELMVVVAIIGILAAIAVPNFQRFQAKSRQSEAKANLGALYSCEKAFFAEWNQYFGNFPDIGFSPEGNLRYRTGFASGNSLPANIGYSGPSAQVGNPANAANYATDAYCTSTYAVSSGVQSCTEMSTFVRALPGSATITSDNTSNQYTFQAAASGIIGTSGTTDEWTIDQVKNLNNLQSGI